VPVSTSVDRLWGLVHQVSICVGTCQHAIPDVHL